MIMLRRLVFIVIIFILEDYPLIQYNLCLFYLGFGVSDDFYIMI